jgi:hypothetical protein
VGCTPSCVFLSFHSEISSLSIFRYGLHNYLDTSLQIGKLEGHSRGGSLQGKILKVIFSEFAKQELEDATIFYEMEYDALGLRFREEIWKAIKRISD